MRFWDVADLNDLYLSAQESPRLRSHLLLHKSHDDKVQRLLIAMVKGSYVDAHYHDLSHQWEMFTVIHGDIQVSLYSDDGSVMKKLTVNASDPLPMIEFFPGDIHSVECLSEKALLLEVKEGPFDEQLPKIFPSFK
ncbi:WbuC family cupin fold metalloprotein [Aeromonas caviae]|uniref:WbuC family cupin fold metalloprotein n=1 Tax=Aeromonas TaxID=642 RepID=UPI0029DA038A|nr:WbuC family cupin fold metalloprotein [Aeromonas caviae]MDX7597085.1 WbuC family cupin fold metalloprotein [Aeromonas caviae]MDX7755636.1 WbuC family cupin fold metalloprotein [Aeromonas caviae]MDX7772750.1 WbuC family cupin fold metalloprotein [Aeromonas caviae]